MSYLILLMFMRAFCCDYTMLDGGKYDPTNNVSLASNVQCSIAIKYDDGAMKLVVHTMPIFLRDEVYMT